MREAVVSGRFYPQDKKILQEKVEGYFRKILAPVKSKGIMVPHAGYIYSGGVAGAVFSYIQKADIYIIMGPNHTGYGSGVSISGETLWETPLGEVKVDDKLKKILLASTDIFSQDDIAHSFEHSIEVQLPFLQVSNNNFTFVPIIFSSIDFETCQKIADGISKTIKQIDKKVVVVASSDMTHYESYHKAKAKDRKVIEKILNLDPEAVWDTVKSKKVSMCGLIPTVIMIDVCKKLGAEKSELVEYKTSGDVTGDKSSVVGYGGVVVH